MPREVAIAMLTAHTARLTNRMRKNCKSALARVFISDVPLLRNPDDPDDPDDGKLYPGVGCTDAQAQFNHDNKVRAFSFAQLNRWKVTLARKRLGIQRAYVKLSEEPVAGESPKSRTLRLRQCAVLGTVAAHLDARRDAIDDELDRRKTACAIVGVT
jgi:hypothetical protein